MNVETPHVLRFLGYADEDYILAADTPGGPVRIELWNHVDPEPTSQEIDTVVASQEFIDWRAENGGDATLTSRKQGSDTLDGVKCHDILIRAALLVIMDEINILRAQHSLAARNATQLRNAIKGKIAAGDADT